MNRDPISRALLFLDLAEHYPVNEREQCEALTEAAIVSGRSALQRLQSRFRKHPDWKVWFNGLLSEAASEFLRHERDWILKEAPPKVSQRMVMGEGVQRACDLYYYVTPTVPATQTV